MIRSFTYPIQVYPHHTDYAGVVWHGAYVNWMEEVRVAFLQSQGLCYAEVAAAGCDLMVVALGIQYRRSAKMGEHLVWEAIVHPLQGVRSVWDYELRSLDRSVLYVTAQVTLVPVNRSTGKVLRHLPPMIDALLR